MLQYFKLESKIRTIIIHSAVNFNFITSYAILHNEEFLKFEVKIMQNRISDKVQKKYYFLSQFLSIEML